MFFNLCVQFIQEYEDIVRHSLIQIIKTEKLSEKKKFQGENQMCKVSLLNCLCIYWFILTDNERKTGCLNTQKKREDCLESFLLLALVN